MKILVAVKRVIDYNVQIRVKEDNTGVVTDNVKMSTNPPDDNAIEEAVKIKEAGKATEVVAVSIGEEKAQETVRKALAVGADRGILVKTDGIIEPLAVSKLLQKIVEKEKPDLVFMGKQAIDDDCNQTGQMLSALLNWPQATFASKIDVKDKSLEFCKRQAFRDALEQSVELIQTERYESVLNIMKEAVSVGMPNSTGHNFFDDIEARFVQINRQVCPTGLDRIDSQDILRGGLGRGELGVVAANTGVGKSHFLVAMGCAAMRAGKNVIHYTFELSEHETGKRYDSNLCNIPSNEIIERKKEVVLAEKSLLTIDIIIKNISRTNYNICEDLINAALNIKGYGHVKEKNIKLYEEKWNSFLRKIDLHSVKKVS